MVWPPARAAGLTQPGAPVAAGEAQTAAYPPPSKGMAPVANSPHLPAVVIALPAELDMASADWVSQQLGEAVDCGAGTVIADMTATTFCDSSGISALVRAHKQAAANGAELRLVVTATAVLRSLALVSIDHLLAIYPSLSLALAAGPPPRHA